MGIFQADFTEVPAVKIGESGEININIPPEGISIEELERKLLEAALIKANWNQTKAAKLLYITRDTMRHRMKKYGLKREVNSGSWFLPSGLTAEHNITESFSI